MKIATWNVNSLKVRMPQVLSWLINSDCDVLALQELKLDDIANEALAVEFKAAGYNYVYNGQKTYNGVGIVSKYPLTELVLDIPGYGDIQKRVVAATINEIRIICAYFVNGESLESAKFQYKLEWLSQLHDYIREELLDHSKLILLGDFNIAPENRDTYDPLLWDGKVLCTNDERQAFRNLLALGLNDAFRSFNQEEQQFTWWDYRNFAFRRKLGLRIDHILATTEILNNAVNCEIDKEPRKAERPSDHTPVILSLS